MNLSLTTKAKEDLKEIARYTQKTLGIKQRNKYLKQIDEIFTLIAISPKKGENCDYIFPKYYKYTIGKHVIFYRQINKNEIRVIRILHSAMDINNHLN